MNNLIWILSVLLMTAQPAAFADGCHIGDFLKAYEKDVRQNEGVRRCMAHGTIPANAAAAQMKEMALKSRDADFCSVKPALPRLIAECTQGRNDAQATQRGCRQRVEQMRSFGSRFEQVANYLDPVKCANEKRTMQIQAQEAFSSSENLQSILDRLKQNELEYQSCIDGAENTKAMTAEACPNPFAVSN